MQKDKLQKTIYFSLFGILFISIIPFVGYLWENSVSNWWGFYSRIYMTLLIVSTWYFFALLLIGDLKDKKTVRYNNEKIYVVMPCYNENPKILRESIKSICIADGIKDIIVINDGSTNNVGQELEYLKKRYGIAVYTFEKNMGKRYAIHFAVKKIESTKETDSVFGQKFIITVDSDTIIDKKAFVEIVRPLKKKDVGATTGDVRLLNEKQNLLTRMVATYYWTGLNIYKKAQASLGMVVCCSGCLSAYKKEILEKIVDKFINQKFLGERCTHSEDRHLTNLVLEQGYKVFYVQDAISYTETPSSIKGLLKQQQRWKRGYIRESIYTLTWSWKTRKILFFEILFWDLTIPFFTFGLHLTTFFILFTNPSFVLFQIIPFWIIFTFIRYIFIFQAKDKIFGMFPYMIFHEIFLYWQNIYALFTVKNKSWITR